MENYSIKHENELQKSVKGDEDSVLNQVVIQELMEKIRKKVNENDPVFLKTLKSLLQDEGVKSENKKE